MGRKEENTGFTCEQCGAGVRPLTNGSYRNHCPFCLYSKHVDDLPGDRLSACGGRMTPVHVTRHSRKGYQILHRCVRCGAQALNKTAADTCQPDDSDLLIGLTTNPPSY